MATRVSTTEAVWPGSGGASGDLTAYQLRSEKGLPFGYAGLGPDGLVPADQLPPPGSVGSDFIPSTEKGAPSGVATLDTAGQVPASQLEHATSSLLLVTKRVTMPIGSDGVSTASGGQEFNQRTLVELPVNTTRWRLRCRNASGLTGNVFAGAYTFTGMWLGTPSYSSSGLPWQRVFATPPTRAIDAFTTASDGAEFTSPWVTDPLLQFRAGRPRGVSHGFTAPAGSYVTSAQGWSYVGSGAAAGASSASPPGATLQNLVALDTRIEYEFLTPSEGGAGSCVVIGDSIAAGWSSDSSSPAASPPLIAGFDPHHSWIGSAGMRNGFAWSNPSIGSTRAVQWASGPGTGWRWTRCDITTTPPDFAIIALGTNDVFDGSSVASVQQSIEAIMAFLRSIGTLEIYLATLIPRSFSGSQETLRTGVNAWMRNMPGGATAIFDHDKATYLQANPAVMDSNYVGFYPHPNRAGHQKMASVVHRGRR